MTDLFVRDNWIMKRKRGSGMPYKPNPLSFYEVTMPVCDK